MCHLQILPDSIRGAMIGLASIAPKNKLALFLNFGSVSLGIPTALSRVFIKVCTRCQVVLKACWEYHNTTDSCFSNVDKLLRELCNLMLFALSVLGPKQCLMLPGNHSLQVGVINFNPYFKQSESAALPFETKAFASDIVEVKYPENVLSSEIERANDVSCMILLL